MGYNWKGMHKITERQAMDRWADVEEELYLLHADGTESLVTCFTDVLDHVGQYGYHIAEGTKTMNEDDLVEVTLEYEDGTVRQMTVAPHVAEMIVNLWEEE